MAMRGGLPVYLVKVSAVSSTIVYNCSLVGCLLTPPSARARVCSPFWQIKQLEKYFDFNGM